MNLKKSLFRCFSLSAIILFALSSPTLAQDTLRSNKVITNTQMLGIGAVNTLDTYLSPEEYTGTEFRYISHSVRENGTKLSRELVHQAQILSVRNRRENNNELGGFYNFQYNWQYALGQWNIGEGELRLKVGGGVDTQLGFLYNMRNSNNPARGISLSSNTSNPAEARCPERSDAIRASSSMTEPLAVFSRTEPFFIRDSARASI